MLLLSTKSIYAAPKWAETLERWTLGRLAPIETALSHWDPVGQAFDRVEELIPGLTIKGFIENETDLQLHHKVDNATAWPPGIPGVPFPPRRPSKSYTFQKIEWWNELEIRYRPQQNWEFVTIADFLYDSAFDWDSRFRHHFRHGANLQEWRNYKNDRILRELYLDLYFRNMDIRIGKQQVVWGKVDGRKIMDIINPEDLREMFDPSMDDWEFSRLPLWMFNLKYWWSDYNIQFLWIPDFTETINEILIQPSPWDFNSFSPNLRPDVRDLWRLASGRYLPSQLRDPWGYILLTTTPTMKRRRPSGLGDDQGGTNEWAFRFRFLKRGFDVAISYFYTWSDTPAYFRRFFLPPPVRNRIAARQPFAPWSPYPLRVPVRLGPMFLLQPTHTRLHQIGINMDKSIFALDRQITFKIENVITLNKYVGVRELWGQPTFRGGNPRLSGFTTGPGLYKKKDIGVLSFAIESYVHTDWFFAFYTLWDYFLPGQYDGTITRGPYATFERKKRNAFSGALSVRKMTYNDRVTLSFLHVQDYTYGGFRTRLTLSFALSDFITLSVGGHYFEGPNRNLIGQFRKNDEIEFGIKYEF